MIIVSYDIANDLKRSRFQRMIMKHGAIRLQFSVYEVVNTKRVIDNMKLKIQEYSKYFEPSDSVVIFEVNQSDLTKYGNAIHRDQDVVFF